MIVLDVNVLIAAFRTDHEQHDVVRSWLQRTIARTVIVVPDLVWIGFLRIVTNARVLVSPDSIEDALGFHDALVAHPAYRSPSPMKPGWPEFRRLAVDARAVGNLVPDAYIAAVADELACPVASMDRDFRRFDQVRLVDPASV